MALLAQTEWEDRPPEREAEWGNLPILPDLGQAEALLLDRARFYLRQRRADLHYEDEAARHRAAL